MAVPHDHLDITYSTPETMKTDVFQLPLADAVAHGRVYILNNRGEMEQVVMLVYWKEDSILSVTTGYEFDENGDVTRDWRQS